MPTHRTYPTNRRGCVSALVCYGFWCSCVVAAFGFLLPHLFPSFTERFVHDNLYGTVYFRYLSGFHEWCISVVSRFISPDGIDLPHIASVYRSLTDGTPHVLKRWRRDIEREYGSDTVNFVLFGTVATLVFVLVFVSYKQCKKKLDVTDIYSSEGSSDISLDTDDEVGEEDEPVAYRGDEDACYVPRRMSMDEYKAQAKEYTKQQLHSLYQDAAWRNHLIARGKKPENCNWQMKQRRQDPGSD